MTAAAAVRPARASAPGKVILSGEHFVVHGAPAVACAIGRRVGVSAGPLAERAVRVETPVWPACKSPLGGDMQGGLPAPLAAVCGMAMRAACGAGAGLRVSVDDGVPLGSGLGASSAWCVAAAAAVRAAVGEEIGAGGAAAAALEAERGAFGMASGIDTAACARGGFGSYSVEGGWRPLNAAGRLRLVVADTGRPHSTAGMVAAVSRFREGNMAEFGAMADESAGISRRAEWALMGRDRAALGKCMSEGHALLSRIGVSTGAADALAAAAEEAGSPGAKITGAGGGGCVVALPGPGEGGERRVEEAMLDAGAASCFATDAGVEGVRVRAGGPGSHGHV